MTSSAENIDVAKILCSDEHVERLQALYQVKENGELTKEDLKVVCASITVNPASYTAWKLYLDILQATSEDIDNEMKALFEQYPKNYQLWNFLRSWYFAGRSSALEQLDIIDLALRDNAKNIHAWSNRTAILKHEASKGDIDIWQKEMSYTQLLLQYDVFNNSAWTQRTEAIKFLEPQDAANEVSFVLEKLNTAPHSIAAWNYLQYLILRKHELFHMELKRVILFCHQILSDQAFCLPCLECLAECYYVIGISCKTQNPAFTLSCLQSAERIWKKCCEIDGIRNSYYLSRLSQLYGTSSEDHQPSVSKF